MLKMVHRSVLLHSHRTVQTVYHTVSRYKMARPGDAVLVGVSGGPDSMALLHILLSLAEKLSLDLGVAHLNHCLRGEASDRDAAFVAAIARKLDLPCHIEKVDVREYGKQHHLCIEEAARDVRYRFFNQVCDTRGYRRVALGHHRDDNVELVLMFLLRGSGARGLSGIPPVRDRRFIRPLIELGRREIADFNHAFKIPSVADRSNMDDRYLRNRVRRHLVPELTAAYNPRVSQTIDRLSKICRDEDQWMGDMAASLLAGATLRRTDRGLTVDAVKLRALPAAALRRVIRQAIFRVKGDLRAIAFSHIEAVVGLVNGQSAASPRRLHLPRRLLVTCAGTRLNITLERSALRSLEKAAACPPEQFSHDIPGTGAVFIPEIGARVLLSAQSAGKIPGQFSGPDQWTAYLDMDRAPFPLTLRNFRPGDRFQPLGMAGTRKVKKIFIDRKVERHQRQRVPILLSCGKILWVAGHRLAETAKVTARTERVLKVEINMPVDSGNGQNPESE